MSELFAKPFGYLSLAERSRRAAELIAPHELTMTSAEYATCSPLCSTMTLVISRPEVLVSRRETYALVNSSTLGCSSAGMTQTTCASALACTRHGNPSHVSQRIQRLFRGTCSLSMMPMGIGKGW